MVLLLLFLVLIVPGCAGNDDALETLRQRERNRRKVEFERLQNAMDRVKQESLNLDQDCWDCVEFVDIE